jgi:CRISPR-associated protein Cmr2
MRNLLLFTIGPVQSFISQARKTQDLYAGSRLLSELIGVAIKSIGEKHVIFPKLGEAMPNKFLAEVPINEINPEKFGKILERKIRDEWRTIAESIIMGIKVVPKGYFQQVESFLEIYWSIESISENQNYADTIDKLEKNIAAIKNIRVFIQYRRKRKKM